MRTKRVKRQSWQKLSKQTGINIAVLKAVDTSKPVEKIKGIRI